MNVSTLINDYIKKNYPDKNVFVEYDYDGDFSVIEFDNSYESAQSCLDKQMEVWSNGEISVGRENNWCQYAEEFFNLDFISQEIKKKIISNDSHQTIPLKIKKMYET